MKESLTMDHHKMKYVRITDKITIMVDRNIPDDVARQEFLLKVQERERRYKKRDDVYIE